MNESYRLGEQSIVAYLQRLANGVSTAEIDVSALPAELRAIGEQMQKTHAILQQERQLLEASPISTRSPILATVVGSTFTSINSGAKASLSPAPISTSITSSIATIRLATPRATATF